MTRTLLISATIFTFACGPSQTGNDASKPAGAASAGSATSAPATSAAGEKAAVTLVGCLREAAPAQPTGTAGSVESAPGARPSSGTSDEAQRHGRAANVHYVLADATVDSGGVGANGAGASGGPLLSAGSRVELDGVPADAQSSVNTQVRVTGRIDAAQPAGTGAAGAASGGSTSTREDVRANSTTVASATPDNGARHMTVDTVQVIAQNCAAR